jgi:hypothetical protein
MANNSRTGRAAVQSQTLRGSGRRLQPPVKNSSTFMQSVLVRLVAPTMHSRSQQENVMSLTISTGNSATTPVAAIADTKDELSLTEVECSRILLVRVLNWYLEKLTICAKHNSTVAAALHNVISLSASPQIPPRAALGRAGLGRSPFASRGEKSGGAAGCCR